jgi:predicted MPP superfamily phosphohydrolase
MIEKNLTDGGITLLRDKAVKIEDSFYVIGRDDTSVKRYSDSERKAIASIDKSIDKSLPIIVLDHQPSNLGEPSNFGADLQFSGHTHKGQFFPNNLITKRIFESDYGYYKKDNMQLIVSSGFGTWGSPIRIGTKSEIVHVNLIFNKE